MHKNNSLINDEKIKDKMDKIIIKRFNIKYDHKWILYIYKNPNIIDYNYCHIYFKNCYIKTILESSLYDEIILNELIDEIIEKIKMNNIKLEIYHLPDILGTNNDYEVLYGKQSSENELNTFANNNEVYIKYISKKLLMIDFSIENDKIIFYVKHSKFFECKIDDFDNYMKNNEIVNKYRKLENDKIKIFYKVNFDRYYDEKFIEFMFLKGFWIDFNDLKGDNYDLSNIGFQNMKYYLNYYDIILYNISSVSFIYKYLENLNLEKNYNDFLMLKNKMFIVLNSVMTFDMHNTINNIDLEMMKKINKFIYHTYPNFYNDDFITKTRKRLNENLKNIYPKCKCIELKNKIFELCNPIYLDTQKFSYNKFQCLAMQV